MKEKYIWSSNQVGLYGLICFAVGVIITLAFASINNETEKEINDDFFAISFNKNFKMFTIPTYIKDGEQYEFIDVRSFLEFDEDGFLNSDYSYGFLRVNQSTNKIEFIKYRTSIINAGITHVYLEEHDIWMNFIWNNSIGDGYTLSDNLVNR